MLDGLDALFAMAPAPLPVVATQHRVIGADTCHFVTPVTLIDDVPVPGKLFITSARLVIAAGASRAWAWHRLRPVTRAGRDLLIAASGGDGARVQCNCFADALVARHLALRLGGR